ncbi:putative sugar phosphate/phosphate translocator [Acorus calamus]|uniref:Sugar phosphate/phosphate translocator n=1 Tax=Acorus calamus TaxID=4465 RepID=A0AAV9DHU3_ACOCL|nr:putative sugar phosphate/phosphate translocator [Acorus calamus]
MRDGYNSGAQALTTTQLISSWYISNIGVLLLNKYFLTIYSYRYLIFLTTLHMLLCSAYCSAAIPVLDFVPLQQIVSHHQLLQIVGLSNTLVVCGNTSLHYVPISFNLQPSHRRNGCTSGQVRFGEGDREVDLKDTEG